MVFAFLFILFIDLICLGVLAVCMLPVALYSNAAFALLRRNFVGYFSNPTGYVFLCVFVVLTSSAAFLPQDFFNNNLATLDQLTQYLPLIMLVFIPAITMSSWAEERRQGTDELLLTLPTTDFDIVFGKYLAAVMIFTISLFFSQLCNFAVLASLTNGNIDVGLFFSTYVGFWMMGLAMISIGMVASFLTKNLTIGFILGVIFNAPLALMSYAHLLISSDRVANGIESWGLLEQFSDFGRGVITLSSVAYFLAIVVLGLYICLVLIGRRHWLGGHDGHSMLGHYLLRGGALVVVAIGLIYILAKIEPVRVDLTEGKINSLSPSTSKLLNELESEDPVIIHCYIGENTPQEYAQTRFELISLMKEFEAMANGKIEVRMHKDLDPYGDVADQAEKRFDIRSMQVDTEQRGVLKSEEVLLGAAFTCGLEQIVIPFFEIGVPVEYELVRSIVTVSQGKKEKIGIIDNGSRFFGGITYQNMSPRTFGQQPLLYELEKQYEIERVDPSVPIEVGQYKVLVAVQPSTMTDGQLTNLINAIRGGQPTAIFEDPLINNMAYPIPGTGDDPSVETAMFGKIVPPAKGNIYRLFQVIGVQLARAIDHRGKPRIKEDGQGWPVFNVTWHRYQPYFRLAFAGFSDTNVIVRNDVRGGGGYFGPDDPDDPSYPITAGIEELFVPHPGSIQMAGDNPNLQITRLVSTSDASGQIALEDLRNNWGKTEKVRQLAGSPVEGRTYDLAVRIQGDSAAEENPLFDTKIEAKPIDVVFVADVDMLAGHFIYYRARPNEAVNFRFDNGSFVLNIIDVLADDTRFVDIRSRKLQLSTLAVMEEIVEESQSRELKATQEESNKFKEEYEALETELDYKVEQAEANLRELQRRAERGSVDQGAIRTAAQTLSAVRTNAQKRKANAERARDAKVKAVSRENERRTNLEIRNVQRWIKIWAVALPPIIPLLIGFAVFVMGRLREREGVSKARLRW